MPIQKIDQRLYKIQLKALTEKSVPMHLAKVAATVVARENIPGNCQERSASEQDVINQVVQYLN
ncbi:MAG: hypothetical protein PUP93_31095 [Rhizonema sp. NSF051]|nr:hypothetical protein [Rhizonema sp. NSF051]